MNEIVKEFNALKENLNNLKSEDLSNFDLNKTDVFIVDMNNGFARGGNLYSPRVEALIDPIFNFISPIASKVRQVVAFTDYHTEDSIELLSYPHHCLSNSIESDVVDELKSIANIKVIPKNSTNGFFALKNIDFDDVENIIIIGDCTDICIYQFAITLKTFFNENNINKNIVVPMDLVDTYHIPNIHHAELLNTVFLNSMIQNGINVVREIKY